MSTARMFSSDKITDGKRLVRGEHWLAVRTFLRQRDRVHNARWRIATLAGGQPAEEIGCLRELMPRAWIVAIDKDEACLEAAIDAGADEVLNVDIFDWQTPPTARGGGRARAAAFLPAPLLQLGKFDAINLDLCGGITSDVEVGLRRYGSHVAAGGRQRAGALMLTFSYGRDVAEIYAGQGDYLNVPAPLGPRVRQAARSVTEGLGLVSVLAYAGNAMPMCSLLWLAGRNPTFEFARVGSEEIAVACVHPEVAPLYALPVERVLAFKRHLAALKAVATRNARSR